MMKNVANLLLALVLLASSCSESNQKRKVIGLEEISDQLELLDARVRQIRAEMPLTPEGQERVVPRTLEKDGSLRVTPAGDWTSGFYPGVLWYMYELTDREGWKDRAIEYTPRSDPTMMGASEPEGLDPSSGATRAVYGAPPPPPGWPVLA